MEKGEAKLNIIHKHKFISLFIMFLIPVLGIIIPMSLGDNRQQFEGKQRVAAESAYTHLDGTEKLTRFVINTQVDDVLPLPEGIEPKCGYNTARDNSLESKADKSLQNAKRYAVIVTHRTIFNLPQNSYLSIVCFNDQTTTQQSP